MRIRDWSSDVCSSDLDDVPNPVIHSCQILDPGLDVKRIEVRSELLKRGRQLGYSRSLIVDADDPSRVLARTDGQGVSLGTRPAGLRNEQDDPIAVAEGPDRPPLRQGFGAHIPTAGARAMSEGGLVGQGGFD